MISQFFLTIARDAKERATGTVVARGYDFNPPRVRKSITVSEGKRALHYLVRFVINIPSCSLRRQPISRSTFSTVQWHHIRNIIQSF